MPNFVNLNALELEKLASDGGLKKITLRDRELALSDLKKFCLERPYDSLDSIVIEKNTNYYQNHQGSQNHVNCGA